MKKIVSGEKGTLISKTEKWKGFLDGMYMFSDDFMEEGREEQAEPKEIESES